MKKLLIFLILSLVACGNSPSLTKAEPPQIEVRFSPHGGCTEMIVRVIKSSQRRLYIQAYSFTSAPIGEAIVEAKHRGVDVQIILDHSNRGDKHSLIPLMMENDIDVKIDAAHNIAHSKIMLIDDKDILSGSFNFSKAAENSNSENCLHIIDRKTMIAYEDNWRRHLEHSHPY